jgi:V/A-type H+-transporting ATPase subunit E
MEAGKEKVKKICDLLRKETLDPAKVEASQILAEAQKEAKEIKERAKRESEELIRLGKEEIEREKEIFQTSLNQGARQAIEYLKQEIEAKLFHANLKTVIEKKTQDPQVLSDLITAVVHALEKEGLESNLSVFIPSSVAPEKVTALLGKEILNKLSESGVLVSHMGGGIEVKLKDNQITLDLSAETLKELLAKYVRKDFRDLIFA